jgi:hypothetical protein
MIGVDPQPPLKPRPKGPWLGLTISVLGGLVLLALCVWGAIASWRSADVANPDSRMTGHGWAALIIAFVMVAVVGGGLMWLAFYSARKGYDDRVGGRDD